jgi:hypothetical protein
MLLGAQDNISVAANVIPATMARLCAAARSSDVVAVRESASIAPHHAAMLLEANPIPVKWAFAPMDKLSSSLPLTPMSTNRREEVQSTLRFALVADASHVARQGNETKLGRVSNTTLPMVAAPTGAYRSGAVVGVERPAFTNAAPTRRRR